MKMFAGFPVVLFAATSLAANSQSVKTNDLQNNTIFSGNSVVTEDGKIQGRIDLYKTFVNDSANSALNFVGLNNANIFFAKSLGENAKVQINTQYGPLNIVGSPIMANNLNIVEAFVTYKKNNVQAKVGKFYSSFGSFNPFRADKSLSEEQLSKLNNNAAEVTYVFDPKSYTKVWFVKPNSNAKEYLGAKVGHQFQKGAAKVSTEVSLLNDAREIFLAPAGVTLNKANAYQGQVVVNYGAVQLTGKVLRSNDLIVGQTKSPMISGLTVVYDTVFSGHNAKLIAEYEKASNLSALKLADKRVALFVKAPIDNKLNLVAGVSERKFQADNRKLRTSSIGLEATL